MREIPRVLEKTQGAAPTSKSSVSHSILVSPIGTALDSAPPTSANHLGCYVHTTQPQKRHRLHKSMSPMLALTPFNIEEAITTIEHDALSLTADG